MHDSSTPQEQHNSSSPQKPHHVRQIRNNKVTVWTFFKALAGGDSHHPPAPHPPCGKSNIQKLYDNILQHSLQIQLCRSTLHTRITGSCGELWRRGVNLIFHWFAMYFTIRKINYLSLLPGIGAASSGHLWKLWSWTGMVRDHAQFKNKCTFLQLHRVDYF